MNLKSTNERMRLSTEISASDLLYLPHILICERQAVVSGVLEQHILTYSDAREHTSPGQAAHEDAMRMIDDWDRITVTVRVRTLEHA